MKTYLYLFFSAILFTQYAYGDTVTVSLAGNTATTGDGFFLNLPVTYSCDVTPGVSDPNFASLTSVLLVQLLQKQNLPKKQFRIAEATGSLGSSAICDGQQHIKNIVLNTQPPIPFQKGLADASIDFRVLSLEAVIDYCAQYDYSCPSPVYITTNAPPAAGSVNVSIVRK